MKRLSDFDKAQARTGDFVRLPAGGYICRILKATGETLTNGSEQLCLALDIIEGEYTDYFKKQWNDRKGNANAKWGCVFRQFTTTLEGATDPYYKGAITCIEESNPGYKWNFEENTLVGKTVGVVFREEEYSKDDGTVGTWVRPAFIRTVARIHEGVEVPAIKRLKVTTALAQVDSRNGFTEVDDSELPF